MAVEDRKRGAAGEMPVRLPLMGAGYLGANRRGLRAWWRRKYREPRRLDSARRSNRTCCGERRWRVVGGAQTGTAAGCSWEDRASGEHERTHACGRTQATKGCRHERQQRLASASGGPDFGRGPELGGPKNCAHGLSSGRLRLARGS